MNDKKSKRIWLPLGIYCLLILIQASLPLPVFRLRHADKVVHFTAYAILGILLFRALSSMKERKSTWLTILSAVLLSAFIGFSDEIIQVFVPTRNIDRVDFFYDVIGSFSGILFYLGIARIRQKNGGETAARTDEERG